MNKKTIFLLCVLASIAAVNSQAQSIFNDDFESYTVNQAPPTTGDLGYLRGAEQVRDEGTGTPFGGSTNQYVELNDSASGNFTAMMSDVSTGANNAVTTFSFDFYEPDIVGQNDSINLGYSRLSSTDSLNSTNSRARINLDDGTIGGITTSTGYNLNTAYRLTIILNDTTSSFDYVNGTIAASSFHVYIQDLSSPTPTFVGSATATGGQGDYYVGFRSFNTQLQTLYVDNFTLESGAAIAPVPEPATLALLLGSLGLFALRRRRGV